MCRANAPEEKKSSGLAEGSAMVEASSSSTSSVQFFLMQASPFDPEFQDPFGPIRGRDDFHLLCLPFRGRTNRQAEKPVPALSQIIYGTLL